MNSAPSCSEVTDEAARGAELLTAATKGWGHEVVQILEADPDLLCVGDPVGDTALHLFARAGNVEAIIRVIEFLQDQHRELLKTVIEQQNGCGDTPMHLAVKNKHKEVALELVRVNPNARHIRNEDGKSPLVLVNEIGENDDLFCDAQKSACFLNQRRGMDSLILRFVPSGRSKSYGMTRTKQYWKQPSKVQLNPAPNYVKRLPPFVELTTPHSITADTEMERMRANDQDYEGDNTILAMLEANPSLIHHKNEMGNTILHKAASFGDADMLTKLVTLVTTYWSNYNSQLHITKLNELVMEKNRDGDTALHLAIFRGHEITARYLIDVAPETVYQVNNVGASPLHLALKYRHHELIKYTCQLMPTSTVSKATIESLLAAKKGSLPHAAVKARNLMMLQMILERMPSLIDASDEKGWKPLSYAAYKGYIEEVGYLLNKFPESAEKFDRDGSLPIHKAVSGGHIDTIKEFMSSHPQSMQAVDKKGRSVLHIAVRYAKADILAYLTQDTNIILNISELRDHDGKTFLDLVKELKRN